MTSSRVRPGKPVAPVRTPSVHHPALFLLLIVVAGAATYWNSLVVPFIGDDQIAIVTNHTIQHLWPLSDALRPPLETPAAGRPIVNLSFAINYAMGGLDETGYHVWNLAVLIASALLLFGIVRRTLAESRVASGFSRTFRNGKGADAVALVSALT